MNDNISLNSRTFNLAYKDKTGSERRDITDGVNLPMVMTIRSQDYVDSQTKKPGRRTVLRFDRSVELSDNSIGVVSAYLVVAAPTDTGVTGSHIASVVQALSGLVVPSTGVDNLNLGDEIFLEGKQ